MRLIVLFMVFSPVFWAPNVAYVLIVAAQRTGVVTADTHSDLPVN
jgi:hypothetical protein